MEQDVTHFSLGGVVHAKLCETPVQTCSTLTPANAVTTVGVDTGVLQWSKPHCPMLLLPHAYTTWSEKCSVCFYQHGNTFLGLRESTCQTRKNLSYVTLQVLLLLEKIKF